MRGALARVVLGLCLLVPALAFSAAGYVHDLTGTVTILEAPNSAPRALRIGDLVDTGNTIRTQPGSTAVIKFEDGQVMVLRESTTFAVTQYAYNKQKVSDSRAVFNLLAGGLRFISGVIGATNPGAYRMTAGTVTIGIRGTDGDVAIDAVTQAVVAAVHAGAVVVRTPQGERAVPANSFVTTPRGSAPGLPAPTAQAPPAVRAAVERSLAHANVPVNTPVVLQASAAAAVAQAQARQAEVRAEQAKAQAAAAAAAAAQQPNVQALAAQAAAAQAAATQAVALAAAAEQRAEQTLSVAVTAAQAAFAQAISNGAVQPAPPASTQQQQQQQQQDQQQKPAAQPQSQQQQQQQQSTSTTGTTDPNSLPASGAGTTADTQSQPAASTTSSSTTSTPSGGAGGGSGGGGTASPN